MHERRRGIEFIAQQPPSVRVRATTLMNHLAARPPQTRADIMTSLGWSRTTLSRIVSVLMDGALLTEEVESAAGRGRGRPVSHLSLRPNAGRVLGVDIGFRSVRTVIAATDHSVEGIDERLLPDSFGQVEALTAAREMADALLMRLGLDWSEVIGAGIAIGAPIRRGTNEVALGGLLPRWSGDFHRAASAFLPCPTYIGNDARLSAHAEMLWGAGRTFDSFLYLKLHSGTGGCVVLDRRIVTGSIGAAGEVGHFNVDSTGLPCRCGNRGCLETVVGVPALLESMHRATSRPIGWEEFRALLGDGDPTAVEVIEDALEAVARTTASLVNVFNPNAVILGGALSRAYPASADRVKQKMAPYTLTVNSDVVVTLADIDRRAGALGGVGLVLTHGVV